MTSRVAAGCGSPTLAVPRRLRARAASPRTPLTARAQTASVGDVAPSAIPANASVLVIGASGRTGKEVVRTSLLLGIPVLVGTRDGAFDVAAALGEDVAAASVVPWTVPRVTPVQVDVTRPETVARAIAAFERRDEDEDENEISRETSLTRFVVFAATAPARGDPDAVDRGGLTTVARACVAAGVPRLVVVSGAGVTARNRGAPAYRFLNAFGGRMDAKAAGEAAVVAAFAESRRRFETDASSEANVGSDVGTTMPPRHRPSYPSYTIIRPSGLLDTAERGVSGLAANRGDVAAGFLGRADLAACVVACGLDARCAFASFEVYDRGTAVPTKTLSVAEILSDRNVARLASILTGQAFRESAAFGAVFDASGAAERERDAAAREATRFERAGFETWGDMFAGIERDAFPL